MNTMALVKNGVEAPQPIVKAKPELEYPNPLYSKETYASYRARVTALIKKGFNTSTLTDKHFMFYCMGRPDYHTEIDGHLSMIPKQEKWARGLNLKLAGKLTA